MANLTFAPLVFQSRVFSPAVFSAAVIFAGIDIHPFNGMIRNDLDFDLSTVTLVTFSLDTAFLRKIDLPLKRY